MLYPNCADAQVCLSILLLAYSMCTKISCASFHFRSMFGQKSYQCIYTGIPLILTTWYQSFHRLQGLFMSIVSAQIAMVSRHMNLLNQYSSAQLKCLHLGTGICLLRTERHKVNRNLLKQDCVTTSSGHLMGPQSTATSVLNICIMHVIKRATGIILSFQFLVDACDAYELPHFYSKNLHCYICNERRDFVQLSDQKYRINAFCPHIKVSVMQISFYAIIDIDLNRIREIDFSQLAKQTGDHECGDYPGEVLDPYMVNIRNTDTLASFPPFTTYVVYYILSHDVASGSEITPSNKIDKPLVVYRFSGNVMASITTLHT